MLDKISSKQIMSWLQIWHIRTAAHLVFNLNGGLRVPNATAHLLPEAFSINDDVFIAKLACPLSLLNLNALLRCSNKTV